tara:strand:+ start:241 stop:450 length:210 start_codon:yes stop_codon:yes gene_type:complete
MKDNRYTPKLYDVIIPEHAHKDVGALKQLFFVMECVSFDMTQLMTSPQDEVEKDEEVLIKILYKSLCAL